MRKDSGFSLVELLVAIGVMGILASAFLFLLNPVSIYQKNRDSDRKSDIKLIQSALELYRSDQGSYPYDSGGSVPALANCPPALIFEPNGTCNTANATIYIQDVPKDPKTTLNYYYCDSATCGAPSGGYAIYSCLENSNDSDKLTATTKPAKPGAGVTSAMACPGTAPEYYGVTNP